MFRAPRKLAFVSASSRDMLNSSFMSTVGHTRNTSAALSSPMPKYAQLSASA